MLLIATSFIIFGFDENDSNIARLVAPGVALLFCIVYFIPSYTFFTHSVLSTWKQEKIRMEMLADQISNGSKDPVIPNYYFPRLLKNTDGYPVFQNPYMLYHFGVNTITEKQIGFDYSALSKCNYVKVGQRIFDGVTLESICIFHDRISGDKKILYRTVGDINKLFNNGYALYSHVFMKDGSTFNKDTVEQALFIDGYWYTYSDAKNLELDKINEIKIGIYNSKTVEIYSNVIVKP